MHQEHRRHRKPLTRETSSAPCTHRSTPGAVRVPLRLRSWGRLLAVVCLMTPILLDTGCASETNSARRRDQQEEYLRDAAKAFWHAVRWGYEDRALVFVATPEAKAQLSDALREGAKSRSIPEFELISVLLDEPLQTGTVRVEVQLIGNSDPVLRRKRLVQTWKLVQGRWFLTVDDALLALYQVP